MVASDGQNSVVYTPAQVEASLVEKVADLPA